MLLLLPGAAARKRWLSSDGRPASAFASWGEDFTLAGLPFRTGTGATAVGAATWARGAVELGDGGWAALGDALSCVIIDKLPFASPSDPITAARIEAIRERGGEPFGEYQVPLAILALQQGLGRLIRHRRDRGVLAVLDPRLRTKGYGRRFLAALPPAPIVHDVARIDEFFS